MAASCQILVPVNKLDLDGNSEVCGRAALAPEVKPDVPIQIRGGSIRSDNETSGFVPGISTRHLKTTTKRVAISMRASQRYDDPGSLLTASDMPTATKARWLAKSDDAIMKDRGTSPT